MKREAIAIDIGSKKVVALWGRKHSDGRIEVLGTGIQTHRRVFEVGEVRQPDEAVEVIHAVLSKALQGKTRRVKSLPVHVAVSGKGCVSRWTFATDNISKTDPVTITEGNVKEVLSIVLNEPEKKGYAVFRFYPFEYLIDEWLQVDQPVGSKGRSLKIGGLAAYMHHVVMENLQRVLQEAGIPLQTLQFEYQPVASSFAVLTEGDRRENFLVLDLGHAKTDLAYWDQGGLRHAYSIPHGSYLAMIQKLHQRFRISPEKAGELLAHLGNIGDPEADPQEITLSLGGQGIRKTIPRREALKVVQKELDRLLEKIRGNAAPQVTGVVVVGGLAQLPGLLAYLEQKLHLPVRRGQIQGIEDLPGRDDPGLAVVAGTLILALHSTIPARRRRKSLWHRFQDLVRNF